VLSTELRILIRDTGRMWWRPLPVILAVYLLGWLGNELTLRIAVILGDISPGHSSATLTTSTCRRCTRCG
jgi:hypothetical protein